MNEKQIIQVIKEELQKVLKEGRFSHFGNYGSSKGWSSSSYSGRRAEKGDAGPDYIPTAPPPVTPSISPQEKRAKGLDFPPVGNHKFYNFDFAAAGDGDPSEGRRKLLGDKFADSGTTVGLWKETDPRWAEYFERNLDKYHGLDNNQILKNLENDKEFRDFFKNWYEGFIARLVKKRAEDAARKAAANK